ncbi:MAG: hypothetical protein R2834_11340 [Rhodothermales bacterium]
MGRRAGREARCRLTDLAHWCRGAAGRDRELGGKLDDDIEMLRWWAPPVQAGDTLTPGLEASGRGRCVAERPGREWLRAACATSSMPSELIADTAPQLALFDDDPAPRPPPPDRHAVRLVLDRRSDAGAVSSGRPGSAPPKSIPGAQKPGCGDEYAGRKGPALPRLPHPDTTAIRLLHEWSTSWVNAAMRTDKGKPAGLIPASVRFPDEAINGDGATWHEAGMLWDYYDRRHSAGSMMLDQLYFTYTLTRDDRMLAPMKAALDLVARHRNEPAADQLPAGTARLGRRRVARVERLLERGRDVAPADRRYDP